ncbi:MAG: ATP-binding cassette domain-containing protein [Bacteroidota bacterium]
MSDTPKTAVLFRDVGISFNDRMIFKGASFEVKMGEFVYVVGKTGMGKSTLLKMCYADVAPDAGNIQVGNYQVDTIEKKEVPFLRRKLGIVFQDFQLLPDRNVFENIRFAMLASGWKDKSRIKQKITEVLFKVGMTARSHSMPYQLSGGEQQRVTIARALVNDPILMVADEPTGNLDPAATQHIMEILRSINLAGTTILMATHEYGILQQYPSRIIEVTEQKIRQYFNTTEFLNTISAFRQLRHNV